ncbi:MAG TPA: 3-deoxy-7-phosphoheptulonate synthase class II, partial [Arthrobacter bacterium]|nr:3-deoxy-7-phosphoheptulonate synthase class II [Arthrobacter sp.]
MVTELSAKPAFSLSSTAQSGAANYPGLDDWRDLPVSQQPSWQDKDVFAASVGELSVLPPLVFAGEVDVLRERLAAAAEGKAFLLQGGD